MDALAAVRASDFFHLQQPFPIGRKHPGQYEQARHLVHQTPACWGKPQSPATNGGCYNLPYEKIGKNEPVCIADEVLFEIPESWEWVRLGNLFQHNTGKALNASNHEGTLLQYITTSNLYWNRFELASLKKMYFTDAEISKCTVTNGDLLVCEGGDIGRAAIWRYDYDICIQNHIHRLRSYIPLCTEFFYYLFYLYKNAGWIGGKGIGIQGLSSNAIHALLFPLPPLNEQKRIVEKLQELKPYTNKYDFASNKIDTLNNAFPEQLKKSILQEAVQGKLVPQDPADEPASALLEHIRTEKEHLIKSGKIKRDKHESVIFRRDNSYYERVDGMERCIDDEIPFEIPESWEWCRLGTILYKLTDGTHSTPKYTAGGIPFISVKDISSGEICFENTKFISESEHEILASRCDPRRDDILLTKVGTTGIPVLVDTDKPFSIFVSVAQLRFSTNLLDKNFLVYLLKSPLVQFQCAENTKGVGNKNWVMRDISNTLICIPPIAEQKRIKARLDSVLQYHL